MRQKRELNGRESVSTFMSQGKDKSIFTITSAHDPNSDLTRFGNVNGRFREGRPLRFRRINPRRYPLSLPLTLQTHTTERNNFTAFPANNTGNDASILDLRSISNRTNDTDNISLIVLDSPTMRNQTLTNNTNSRAMSSTHSTQSTTDDTDDTDDSDVSFLLWDTRSESEESDSDDTESTFTTSTESDEMHESSCAT